MCGAKLIEFGAESADLIAARCNFSIEAANLRLRILVANGGVGFLLFAGRDFRGDLAAEIYRLFGRAAELFL